MGESTATHDDTREIASRCAPRTAKMREARVYSGPEELDAVRHQAELALAAWALEPDDWEVVGAVPGSLGAELRPVIQIGPDRYVVRRQPPDLLEADVHLRHDFMVHLTAEGLPVPQLLVRPTGSTYALVAGDFYELQQWREGARYQSSALDAGSMIEAAAATLGALHQASAMFGGAPHRWPDDRAPHAVAMAYLDLIRQMSERPEITSAVASAAARVADACGERIAAAADALQQVPGPPELHIHGDYQPHNLAFAPHGVAAIYDFDAVRWTRRLDEVAYALMCFAGLRNEPEGMPGPLVDDGLDVLRAHTFLQAYGRVAPPAADEAALLGDAVSLVFPVVLANGVIEDLVFADDFGAPPPEEAILPRLAWADAFWLWLDRYRHVLAEEWESAARRHAR
jgi:Ser/Thr protein kinase RdoA (MazF antagonist)